MASVAVATKALIVRDGKILFIKQAGDGREYLDLPGGRMEYGLTPEENLRREIMEEIGCKSEIGELLGYTQFFRDDSGDQVVCLVFKAMIEGEPSIADNPDKDEDISEILWLRPGEVMAITGHEFVEGLKPIISRLGL